MAKSKIAPYDHLTINQRKIFTKIKNHLEQAEQLEVLDEFLINQIAVAIDRLNEVEMLINENPQYITDTKIQGVKEKYSKDFYKGIDHLGMSPSARAKLGSLVNLKKEIKSDPVLKVLGD